MSNQIDSFKLEFHLSVIAVVAASLAAEKITPKFAAQRIEDELKSLAATAGVPEVTVRPSEVRMGDNSGKQAS